MTDDENEKYKILAHKYNSTRVEEQPLVMVMVVLRQLRERKRANTK